jgi:hypothetical protein
MKGVGMDKVSMVIFCLAVLLVSCGASSACPVGGDCPPTEITVNSFGISGRVVLAERRRERRAGWVEVDVFYFRQGEWQPTGGIPGAVGGFGWKSEEVGRYNLSLGTRGSGQRRSSSTSGV